MGTWGAGIMDSDEALDTIDKISSAAMREIAKVLSPSYLRKIARSGSDTQEVMAAVEYIIKAHKCGLFDHGLIDSAIDLDVAVDRLEKIKDSVKGDDLYPEKDRKTVVSNINRQIRYLQKI